jgi:excisionase family DNA binding protein
MTAEILLRPSEVAHRLGVYRTTPTRWFNEGKITGAKVGYHVKLYLSGVRDFLLQEDGMDLAKVEELFRQWGWIK